MTEVRHLHVWALSTSEVALTVHLVMPWPASPPTFLSRIDRDLAELGIQHPTVQIDAPTPLEPA